MRRPHTEIIYSNVPDPPADMYGAYYAAFPHGDPHDAFLKWRGTTEDFYQWWGAARTDLFTFSHGHVFVRRL